MQLFRFVKQKIWEFIYPPERFFRYLVCGCGAAVINYSFFLLFSYVCRFHFTLSMFLAVVLTWIYSFFANKFFVFQAREKKTFREGALFAIQQIVLFGVANGIMWVCVRVFKIPEAISWLLVSGAIMIINFAGMRFIIWRKENA